MIRREWYKGEKDNYVSYGLPSVLKNLYFNHSDGFNPYVCKDCG